jgi:hypothetical protein
MKKLKIFIFLLCAAFTDNVYRAHVYAILATPIPDEFREEYPSYTQVLVRKSIRYSKEGSNELEAAKCAIIDLYRSEFKVQGVPLANIKHGIKHWLDEIYPGEGFEP